MICESCSGAGELNWLLNTGTIPTKETESMIVKVAMMKHAACTGQTSCDCQHKLGKHLETT